MAENPDWVCAEGDESSAFQRVSRDEMRRALLEHLPEFIPYFSGAYDAPAGIHYDGHTMEDRLSRHGCQQGCSWGTLLFALARLRMHKRLREQHPDVHILSMSDDIFIVGPPAAVAAAFADWRDSVQADGGQPNIGKCRFWGANRAAVGHESILALKEFSLAETANGWGCGR